MIYVVSDIHGCYDTFLALLNKVKFDNTKDTLYILGDIIDRGPKSWEMYEWVKEHLGKNVFMIMGNHEDMMIQDVFCKYGRYLKENKPKNEWTEKDKKYISVYNTQSCVYDQYKTIKYLMSKGHSLEELVEMCEFFSALPYYYEVEVNNKRFRLVHAYCRKEIEKTRPDEFIWNRDFAEYDVFCRGENVIFGHTPTICFDPKGNIIIEINEQADASKINIDCGCVYDKDNKLCILRLDDMKYWYQKNIDWRDSYD